MENPPDPESLASLQICGSPPRKSGPVNWPACPRLLWWFVGAQKHPGSLNFAFALVFPGFRLRQMETVGDWESGVV